MLTSRFVLSSLLSITLAGMVSPAPLPGGERGASESDLFRASVEADWAGQERRLGRTAGSEEAVRAALARGERLLAKLAEMPKASDIRHEAEELKRLRQSAQAHPSLDETGRLAIYRDIRWAIRDAAFKNPLVSGKPLAFLQRRRFISQMLHEYLGYFYDYGDIAGGGVYVLEEPGRSLKHRDLIRGRLPRGNYTTLALSYDAKMVYFGFCERAAEKPDYYSPGRRAFHLYAVDADGRNLRQLTSGPDDDFDPCPLPDGGLAFMSTRRGGFGRCHNPWEPLPTYTLHRLEPSGGVRILSFHETNQWHPSVLDDGRIVYVRWDYVDRSAANYHGLWVSNPDGTNPHILFGNYTERINACYQPRSIPGSRRVAFVAGAHHAAVGGSLVLVDPARTQLDPRTGLDRFEAVESLTPEVCFPEAPGWPKSYFHSPWPLSEDFYLVSFSFDPLPGMGPGVREDTQTGLYYFDRFGNLELLFREKGISAMYPVPLVPRPRPPAVPSTLDPTERDEEEGELYVADVRRSLMPLPEGRPIVGLRVWQVLPKTETHVANQPRLGYANAESARMLLGTVPVDRDGSAYFRVPAKRPLYFQAVDSGGRAVQTMRSVTYVQPGERRGCVGCHEPPQTAPPRRPPLALRRPPSAIEPGPDGTRPFSFVRLVQPVLDRHCVGCHDGDGQAKGKPALTGKPQGEFSLSYENLKPFVRWYEWGGKSIAQAVTVPGHGGGDESPLLGILEDANHKEALGAGLLTPPSHRPQVSSFASGDLRSAPVRGRETLAQHGMPAEDRLRLTIWLDGNASFYGAYSAPERLAQRRGEDVPPPRVQ